MWGGKRRSRRRQKEEEQEEGERQGLRSGDRPTTQAAPSPVPLSRGGASESARPRPIHRPRVQLGVRPPRPNQPSDQRTRQR
jgi:hypothetical protein